MVLALKICSFTLSALWVLALSNNKYRCLFSVLRTGQLLVSLSLEEEEEGDMGASLMGGGDPTSIMCYPQLWADMAATPVTVSLALLNTLA
jgi:hypothetical protein